MGSEEINDYPVLNEDGFLYKVRELNELDFKIFGPEISKQSDSGEVEKIPLVTKEVCDRVNLVAIEVFYRLSKDGEKIMMFRENETFPIYGFVNTNDKGKEWVKIYMPKGKKSLQKDGKDFRFQHLGLKKSNFIYGLEEIREDFREEEENAKERWEEELQDIKDNPAFYSSDDILKLKQKIERNKFQFDRICIATGGSDGLNLMALGEKVIWKNSETDHISPEIMDELLKMAKDVVNIPDLDQTGRTKGTEFALQYIDMKTFWISDFSHSTYVKDFKDYVTSLKSLSHSKLIKEVKKNLELAMPAKFWEVSFNDKTRKTSYNFNKSFGNYFLKLNGFLRVDDDSRKEGYYFAKIDGHIVEELKTTQPIKDFFKNFLMARQKKDGIRKIPFELINTMIDQPRMSDSNLASLENRNLDFSDYDYTSQYLFFTDKIWKITRHGTQEVKTFKNYVLKSQLVDELIYKTTEKRLNTKALKIDENQFKKKADGSNEVDSYGNFIPEKKPYFKVSSVGENLYGVEILEKNCDFQNFLIQTSRVHWEAERAEFIKRGYKEEDFFEKTKFKIRSEYLTEEQNQEQETHLANKKFTLGYTFHRFKDSSRPWVPFGVDNAVTEDKVAEGGSGKGLFMSVFNYFMSVIVINGKSEFEKDRFWLENVTKHTDLILIDDVKRNFDLQFLYSITTGNMEKDTKNVSKEIISKKDSPKLAVLSNYALRDMQGSSIRRRLLFSFSDIYHSKDETREERNPTHDFGYNLFDDWDEPQWFKTINYVAQCTSYYLGCKNKIEAPDNNIMRRVWLSEMGEAFRDWADSYYPEYDGEPIPKYIAEEAVKHFATKNSYVFLKSIQPQAFKKKTEAWAKYNGYDFEDRISKNLDIAQQDERGNYILDHLGNKVTKRQTKEHIKLTKKSENDIDDEITDDDDF